MKMNKKLNILIIGLGLMGGSYAMALKKKGYRVFAITKDEKSIAFAKENGIIDEGFSYVCEEAVKNADLLIFALYPNIFVSWIKENGHLIKKGAYITDVTGVKSKIIKEINEVLPEDVEFIAAHPMAGREVYGVENATDTIFREANFIVVPTKDNTPDAIELCKELGMELGFKRVTSLNVAEHDKMIAFLSQLTHCIAVSLMCTNDNPKLCEYTGDSFRDLTRIAKINENMWSELFMINKEPLLSEIDAFMKELDKMRNYIVTDDLEGMKEMMICSTQRRKTFDKA